MSRLDDLIQEYCPDGVEYKPLECCCVILDNKRKPITKGLRETGNYPYYGANGIQDYVSNYIFDGTFVLVGEDGSVLTENGTPVVNWAEGKIWVNNHAHIIAEQEGVMLRYLFHYLQTVNISSLIHGNIPKLTGKDFKAIRVPLPALPVQREIVHVLDEFTMLSAELAAELAARKKQYEYYRNRLLAFDETVPMVTLPEISKNYDFKRKPVTKGKRLAGEYPYYGASGIVDYVADYLFDGNYLLISEDGANLTARVTPIAFSIEGKTWVNNHAHILKFENSEVQKFVEIYLNSIDLSSFISGGAQPKLNQANLNKIKIPFPGTEAIAKITSVLSSFDTICSDISTGLPAEIEARQKQYEYYRDKLLTFKELKS